MMMLATLDGSWLRGVYLNNGHLGHWPRPPLRTNGSGRSQQLLCRYWCKPTPARDGWKTRRGFDSCFSFDIYVSYIFRRQAHKSGATKYEQLYQSIWLYLMICYFPTARKGIISYLCTLCVATSQKYQHYEQSILRRGGGQVLNNQEMGSLGTPRKGQQCHFGAHKITFSRFASFLRGRP